MEGFFFHLLTISVGLLIAVGIEGCVELHREHKLVREAQETMRDEIQHNSDTMKDVVVSVKEAESNDGEEHGDADADSGEPGEQGCAERLIDLGGLLHGGIEGYGVEDGGGYGGVGVYAVWEAQRYSDVYGAQKSFLDQQDKIMEDEAQFFGVMAKTNFGHNDVVTKEQASLALERFGIWNAHLLFLDLMAQLAAGTDKAFLEGKAPPTDIHEEVHRK